MSAPAGTPGRTLGRTLGRDVPACLILGCGYAGARIATELAAGGTEVVGTRRGADGLAELEALGVRGLAFGGGAAAPSDALASALARTTHLVSSVAPVREPPLDDPMLDAVGAWLERGLLPRLEWIGYLSTIGVYGDHGGAWVDEDAPCTSAQPRSIARREAELAWAALGERAGAPGAGPPVATLRLSGIYGPGRNAVRDALAGRARMLIKPGQVFNRIHVDDLARATALAARVRFGGTLNVTDDEPAPPQDVIRHAHALAGREPPPAVDFETADVSPMARSFYAESKRVANARSKRALGLVYRFPDYRAGLASLVDGERRA